MARLPRTLALGDVDAQAGAALRVQAACHGDGAHAAGPVSVSPNGDRPSTVFGFKVILINKSAFKKSAHKRLVARGPPRSLVEVRLCTRRVPHARWMCVYTDWMRRNIHRREMTARKRDAKTLKNPTKNTPLYQ